MNSASRWGLLLVIIGLAINSPLLILFGVIDIATTPLAFAATAGVASVGFPIFLSLATSVFLSVGAYYFYTAALSAYRNPNSTVIDIVRERMEIRERNFINYLSAATAVILSPLLIAGALSGFAVHYVREYWQRTFQQPRGHRLQDSNEVLSADIIAAGLGQSCKQADVPAQKPCAAAYNKIFAEAGTDEYDNASALTLTV